MERKSRKIGIIGHFGGKENILDGQTIKTKILHERTVKGNGLENYKSRYLL